MEGGIQIFSPAAHAEAVNLARTLSLLILEAKCPRVALRSSIVLEILLRRLFCVMEVEKMIGKTNITRIRD